MAGDAMDTKEGPTNDTSLNQYNSHLHSAYESLCPQISIPLIPNQRRFFVRKKEAKIAESN